MMAGLKFKKFWSFFLLLLFLGVEGLNYHYLSHANEEGQITCELCEVVLLQDVTSDTVAGGLDFQFSNLEFPEVFEVLSHQTVLVNEAFLLGFYSRPPPSIG